MLAGSTILFVSLSFVVILSTKRHGTLASKSIGPPDESSHCSRQDGQSYCHRSIFGTSELPSCRFSNVRLNMGVLFQNSLDRQSGYFVGTMFSIDGRHVLVHEDVLKQAKVTVDGLNYIYTPNKELIIDNMQSFRPGHHLGFKVLQHLGDLKRIEFIKLDYNISNWEGIKMPIAKRTMYKDCILYSYSWSPIDLQQQKTKGRWFSGHRVNITDPRCDSNTCNFKFHHGGVCSGLGDLGSPIICQGYLAYMVINAPDDGCSSDFAALNVAKEGGKIAKLISFPS